MTVTFAPLLVSRNSRPAMLYETSPGSVVNIAGVHSLASAIGAIPMTLPGAVWSFSAVPRRWNSPHQ